MLSNHRVPKVISSEIRLSTTKVATIFKGLFVNSECKDTLKVANKQH